MGGDNKPVKPNGMPLLKEEEKNSSLVLPILFTIIPLVIGSLIAYAIYSFGSTDKYAAKISSVSLKRLSLFLVYFLSSPSDKFGSDLYTCLEYFIIFQIIR
jgi:hypothetical protein